MAETANTAWYRQGTVSVTNGSTRVTGKDTRFLTAGINPGATLRLDAKGDFASEIASVVSDTELELATPYYGGTASNQTYSIDRNHQSTLPATIAARLAGLAGKWEARYDLDMETITGKSAYEVAVENGYTGTVAQWLESLKAAKEWDALDERTNMLTYHNAGTHNLPRGRDLGLFSDEQSAAIRAGTFNGVQVVDFWKFTNVPYSWYRLTADTTPQEGKTYYADINGTELETQPEAETDISEAGYYEKIDSTYSGTMRVGGCDDKYKCGPDNGIINAHHVVVVPDAALFNAIMNPTNTTEGGYALSQMRTVHMKRAEAIFKACFGESHVLKHKEYLVNAVRNGKPSAGAWYDSYCDLMDERMVYGSLIFDSGAADGTDTIPNRQSISCAQLSLFRLRPYFRQNNRVWYWLRNVVSATRFACVNTEGTCHPVTASYSYRGGVRPAALIY